MPDFNKIRIDFEESEQTTRGYTKVIAITHEGGEEFDRLIQTLGNQDPLKKNDNYLFTSTPASSPDSIDKKPDLKEISSNPTKPSL
ncbi:MAG: hypothetical protein ACKOAD_06910 [Gammaproteobacteria bacterium]